MSTEALLHRARQLAADANREADTLQQQRDELDAQVKELRRIARGFVASFNVPKPKSQQQSYAHLAVSPERAATMAEGLFREFGTEQFTAMQATLALGYNSGNSGAVREGIAWLRNAEFLGLGKKEREEGRTNGTPSQHFFVIHPNPESFIEDLSLQASNG